MRLRSAPIDPTNPAMIVTPPNGPLSESDLGVLSQARRRLRKVRRAAGVATLSGWTLAFFGALTCLGVIFGDVTALILGVLLCACAANELRGASMLRALDERAPGTLGWNQIGLGVLIVAYAGWSLYRATREPALASMGGTTGDADLDRMVTSLTTTITYAFYAGLAGVGVLAPGLTALYYFTRARHLRRALHDTPRWAVQTLRAAA